MDFLFNDEPVWIRWDPTGAASNTELKECERIVVLEVPVGREDWVLQWLGDHEGQLRDRVRIAWLKSGEQSDPASIVASGLVDFIVSSREQLEVSIEISQKLARQRLRRSEELKDARTLHRRLEEVRLGLERNVALKMQGEEDSKRDSEMKRANMRTLMVFAQDLASAQSVLEIVSLLRKDLRSHHRVQDPALAYLQSDGEPKILSFRAGRIVEVSAATSWRSTPRLRVNEVEDSQYLANVLGRPVTRVLAFPLIARRLESYRTVPTLFIEHQLNGLEMEAFIQTSVEKIQAVTIALDRLLLEVELKEASLLWEKTFDGMDEPVAILDPEGRVLRSNTHFARTTRADECFRAFSGGTKPCEGCPVAGVLEKREPTTGLVRRGRETFQVHSYPVREGLDGPVTALVNHYEDLTTELELQERMVQNEKMAALGHLAGNIAHELNNPLTGIRGLVQVLARSNGLTDRMREDLREVEVAASRSQAIIANLLQFAQGGKDRLELADLNEVVGNTLPLLKTAMGAHRQSWLPYPSPALAIVHPQLLQQVVFNLVKNACQAMPEGGDLEIAVEPDRGDDGQRWTIRVSDTGIGMPPDVVEKIFTPFFTTKASGQGTGLGLSLSSSLIARMGGEMRVDSVPGQGTTMRIVLKTETKK